MKNYARHQDFLVLSFKEENKMEDKDLFQVVLDNDEQVIKVLRPHKGRAWFSTIVGIVIFGLMFLPFGILSIVLHNAVDADGELIFEMGIGMGIFVLALWAVIALVGIICIALWCNKTVYALTNKRVLIRTGYIGVDYKSLDLSMVGALSVNVSLADKIVHKNTGTIAFGSMASPMTTQNVSKFNFAFVHDPYTVYKEVKAYIDQKKSSEGAKK